MVLKQPLSPEEQQRRKEDAREKQEEADYRKRLEQIKNFTAQDLVRSKLRQEIADLQREIRQAGQSLDDVSRADAKTLRGSLQQVADKERLLSLLGKLDAAGQEAVERHDDLKESFLSKDAQDMVVMSIDIRRSTDLMLQALTPLEFARFISKLCEQLANVIKKNYGVVDKFTGDGLLAYFPTFYAGMFAAQFAVRAAVECHATFAEQYKKSHGAFQVIFADTGLGIGIDAGQAQILSVSGEFTIVGTPVVYACRLAGWRPGSTLLNEQAWQALLDQDDYEFEECTYDIKNEGCAIVRSLKSISGSPTVLPPDWSGEN